MSESASSADSASVAGGDIAAPVQFSPTTESVFADTVPSDWAFAAQQSLCDGLALDAVDNEVERSLPPLVAIATFVAIESDLFDAAPTPLVAFAPAFAGEDAIGEMAPEAGMIMSSGEAVADRIEPVASHQGESVALPSDFVSHGLSYDWTDPLFYS